MLNFQALAVSSPTYLREIITAYHLQHEIYGGQPSLISDPFIRRTWGIVVPRTIKTSALTHQLADLVLSRMLTCRAKFLVVTMPDRGEADEYPPLSLPRHSERDKVIKYQTSAEDPVTYSTSQCESCPGQYLGWRS
jgi:hypothetical protein